MDFSDLALAKLLQTVPELGPLILSFQELTEELGDESGIRVGIFILQAGTEVFYIPVVSRNDSIYPIDSMFVDSSKKFVPLTKKIVEAVVSSNQMEQGKSTKIPKTVPANPSVYGLINPPRTGKYAYASASRLSEFLAAMPDGLKTWVFEKVAAEKSVYDNLDKMFGLKAIFDVLRPNHTGGPSVTGPSATSSTPVSVATGATPVLSLDGAQSIIQRGFAIEGHLPMARVAISNVNFNRDAQVRLVEEIDGDRDFPVAFSNGGAREAFIPKFHRLNRQRGSLAIFTNGDYALSSDGFVSVGESRDRKQVLTDLFEMSPPTLLRDVYNDEVFVIVTNSGGFLGPFTVSNVTLSNLGVEVSVRGSEYRKIHGYRNFKYDAEDMKGELYVPFNAIVVKLNKNVTLDLESSVNSALKRRELTSAQLLGDELNLGFDGVEFSANGKPVGGAPQVMEMLVVREGIAPDAAENFIKQAQESKRVKIYMTKRAFSSDAAPAEIPQYGILPDTEAQVGKNGAFMPNVQESANLGDGQVVEATIMSELLQVPDLFGQIEEYMPDIEEAVDKLGRILFITRVKIDQLSKNQDPESVFSLLAQIKSVYRLLGENLMKLKQLVEVNRGISPEAEV